MKQGKRVSPVVPFDYAVLVTRLYKEREKITVTRIALRTLKEFNNFRYEIIVNDTIDDHVITLDIEGLRAPQHTIPGSGPAMYVKEFLNLTGRYTLIIRKNNKQSNTFYIEVGDQSVKLLRDSEEKFVSLVTTEDEW